MMLGKEKIGKKERVKTGLWTRKRMRGAVEGKEATSIFGKTKVSRRQKSGEGRVVAADLELHVQLLATAFRFGARIPSLS